MDLTFKGTARSLDVRASDNYEESYSDRGTGSDHDLSVFRPRLLTGEYRVTYTASTSRDNPQTPSPVVKQASDSAEPALAIPDCFECKWCDKSTGGDKDGSLWKAHAPSGYVALSDVAVHISNDGVSPGSKKRPEEIDPDFRCVHVDLVANDECGSCVWTDKGSKGCYNGSLWDKRNSPGMLASSSNTGGDVPPNHQYKLKAFTHNLYKDMVKVFSFDNPHSEDQPAAKHILTVGLTTTSGTSSEFSSEFGMELSQKASAGVDGVCSTETEAKFSMKLGVVHQFCSEETSSQSRTLEVSVLVKAHTRTELWQMVVTDSKLGAHSGSFLIHSEHYSVVYVPL